MRKLKFGSAEPTNKPANEQPLEQPALQQNNLGALARPAHQPTVHP